MTMASNVYVFFPFYATIPFLQRLRHRLRADGIETFVVLVGLKGRWIARKLNLACLPTRRAEIAEANPLPPAGITERDVLDALRFSFALPLDADKKRLLDFSYRFLSYLDAQFTRARPDLLVILNGAYVTESLALLLGRRLGLKMLFAENGYLPGTMQLDPQGVNAQSSICDVPDEVWLAESPELEPESLKPIEYVPTLEPGRLHPAFERALFSLGFRLGILKALDPFEGLANKTPLLLIEWYRALRQRMTRESQQGYARGTPFVFLPFQVESDTQVLLNSPYVKSMREFLALCLPAIRRALPGYAVVVKEHPAEFGQRSHRASLRAAYPEVLWLRDVPIRQLFEQAALVITINSTAGFEAMFFGKPVITLGESFYNKQGVVLHAEHPEDLEGHIVAAIAGYGFDQEKRQRFIRYVGRHHFVKTHWRNLSPRSVEHFCQRLLQELSASSLMRAATVRDVCEASI